jgi:prefoldin subunit 5
MRISQLEGSLRSAIEDLESEVESLREEARDQVRRINRELSDLRAATQSNSYRITRLSYLHSQLASTVEDLQEEVENQGDNVSALQDQVNGIQSEISSIESSVASLEDGFADMADSIAALEGAKQIVAILDPCGNGSGHDEVLVAFDDGSVMAWYKDLGLTMLTPNVTYQTTDSQRCNFRVNSNGQLN